MTVFAWGAEQLFAEREARGKAAQSTQPTWAPGSKAWGLRGRWFADSSLEGTVTSELVSAKAISLFNRENTGNFIDFGLGHLNLSSKRTL